MSKKTDYYRTLLELADYRPKIAMEYRNNDKTDVGMNLARQIEEINKKMYKDYISKELRKAELEEVREVARREVLNALKDVDLSVELNGDKITEAVISMLKPNENGRNGG